MIQIPATSTPRKIANHRHRRLRDLNLPRNPSAALADSNFITTPYTIVIDNQEGHPWTFQGIRGDSKQKNKPLLVKTVSRKLKTGDYTIEGFEHLFAIERKSLEDLYGSLGGAGGERRRRLEAEHERMHEIILRGGWCALICEADARDFHFERPDNSGVSEDSADGARIAWGMRYKVPWMFEGTRRNAELTAFYLIEMFWRMQQHGQAREESKVI